MGSQEFAAKVNDTNKTRCDVSIGVGPNNRVRSIPPHLIHAILMCCVRYLQESPADVQEQTFNILRNVAESHQGIDIIFENITVEVLMGHITSALTSSSDDVMLQASRIQLIKE